MSAQIDITINDEDPFEIGQNGESVEIDIYAHPYKALGAHVRVDPGLDFITPIIITLDDPKLLMVISYKQYHELLDALHNARHEIESFWHDNEAGQ